MKALEVDWVWAGCVLLTFSDEWAHAYVCTSMQIEATRTHCCRAISTFHPRMACAIQSLATTLQARERAHRGRLTSSICGPSSRTTPGRGPEAFGTGLCVANGPRRDNPRRDGLRRSTPRRDNPCRDDLRRDTHVPASQINGWLNVKQISLRSDSDRVEILLYV